MNLNVVKIFEENFMSYTPGLLKSGIFKPGTLVPQKLAEQEIVQPLANYFMGPQNPVPQTFVEGLRAQHPEFMSSVLMGTDKSVLALFVDNKQKNPAVLKEIAVPFMKHLESVIETIKSISASFSGNETKIVNEAARIEKNLCGCLETIAKQFGKLVPSVQGLEKNSVEPTALSMGGR